MAWMSDHWITRAERDQEIEELATLAEDLNGIDLAELPPDDVAEIEEAVTELERLERINAAEDDLIAFALEYFSEARNPGNPGNWEGFDITDVSDAPIFHREISDIMDNVSNNEVNAKVGVAAPRSHAKSTYLSKAFPLREICYRKRRYGIIISETPTVSSANLDWISNQLKYNEKLRRDFGPLLSQKSHENIRDNSSEFIAWEPTETGVPKMVAFIQAASTGQALRGRNWNGARPDLIVCDDLEDIKSNAATPEQREKMKSWFSQSVMPLGDPKGLRTAIIYMGTTVHHEALLIDVLYNRSDFKSKVYRAIIEFPERMDLWEECRQIYTNREISNRADEARRFYEDNREEMDAGAIVLWSDAQPIWKLMTWKWDNGSKAFNTEYMNNPIDEESMIFRPDSFAYWDGDSFSELLSAYPRPPSAFEVYFGIDFAMGKQRGDYSAIAVMARHKTTGIKFVLDMYLERVKPDIFIEVIVRWVLRYQPDGVAVEAQAAQEFFADKLKQALRAADYPVSTRVHQITQRQRKELRIEALLPDIENGTIRFSAKHGLLIEQFEMFPNATHDDGPDALEMANSIAKKGRKKLRNKPRNI